eukprot:scaffold25411_cov152-Cylindrotheca_fusiformis.AAC.4
MIGCHVPFCGFKRLSTYLRPSAIRQSGDGSNKSETEMSFDETPKFGLTPPWASSQAVMIHDVVNFIAFRQNRRSNRINSISEKNE